MQLFMDQPKTLIRSASAVFSTKKSSAAFRFTVEILFSRPGITLGSFVSRMSENISKQEPTSS